MAHEVGRGPKELEKHLVSEFQLSRLVIGCVVRVELLHEQLSAFLPCFPIRHEPKKPVKANSINYRGLISIQ